MTTPAHQAPPSQAPAQVAPAAAPKGPPGDASKGASRTASPARSSAGTVSFHEPTIARTAPGSTAGLIAAVGPLVGTGMSIREAMILAGPPFPVAGMARYTDDFLTPRLVPYPHLHQGTDVFADFGTPIVASGPGRVQSRDSAPVGGLEMWVSGDDGVNYYYAHLLSFSDTARPGEAVGPGTVLGYVGNTGDAAGGPPHLHFEIHPPWSGRDKVLASGVLIAGIATSSAGALNPKPILDAWLAQAQQRAQALAAKAAGTPAQPAEPSDAALAARNGNPAELVWFSVFEPALGSVGLARQAAAAGVPASPRDSAEAAVEAQRKAEVSLAVRTPYVQLGEITHQAPDSPMGLLVDMGSP